MTTYNEIMILNENQIEKLTLSFDKSSQKIDYNLTQQFFLEEPVHSLHFNPNDNSLYCINEDQNQILMLENSDIRTRLSLKIIPPRRIQSVRDRFLITGSQGRVEILDVIKGLFYKTFEPFVWANYDREAERILLLNPKFQLEIFDLREDILIDIFSSEEIGAEAGKPLEVVKVKGEDQIYVVCADGYMRVVDYSEIIRKIDLENYEEVQQKKRKRRGREEPKVGMKTERSMRLLGLDKYLKFVNEVNKLRAQEESMGKEVPRMNRVRSCLKIIPFFI